MLYWALLIVGVYFFFPGLVRGRTFLAPIAVLTGILAFQVKRFTEEWPTMNQKPEPKITQLQQYISEKTGLTFKEQNLQVQ